MPSRDQFLQSIHENPMDQDLRQVFADWLDEQGDHDEAERQRKYLDSVAWLREFARKHHGFGYEQYRTSEEQDKESRRFHPEYDANAVYEYDSYHQLLYFLSRHVDGDHYLPFDTPYGFDEYSDELWGHFEVITAIQAPQDEYRSEMPPFRCSC